MGSNAPTPLTTTTIKTTEDAIKFFRLLRAGCRMRGLEWWLNDALDEFPSVDAREAAARALNKAKRYHRHTSAHLSTNFEQTLRRQHDTGRAADSVLAA
jgi:hypothetical protein